MLCPPKSGSRVGEAEATGSGSAWSLLGVQQQGLAGSVARKGLSSQEELFPQLPHRPVQGAEGQLKWPGDQAWGSANHTLDEQPAVTCLQWPLPPSPSTGLWGRKGSGDSS